MLIRRDFLLLVWRQSMSPWGSTVCNYLKKLGYTPRAHRLFLSLTRTVAWRRPLSPSLPPSPLNAPQQSGSQSSPTCEVTGS